MQIIDSNNGDESLIYLKSNLKPCLIYDAGMISLSEFVIDLKIKWTHYELTDIFLSIFEIIKKLNEKQIYHCDIKLTNIVIDSKGMIKLIDLGGFVFNY